MTDALIEALARQHRLLDEVARAVTPAEMPPHPPSEMGETVTTLSITHTQQLKREHRQRRLDRYESTMEKVRQGLPQSEIARSAACGARRFAAGHERMVSQNAEPLFITPGWKPTVSFWNSAGSRNATMPRNSGANCGDKVSSANQL